MLKLEDLDTPTIKVVMVAPDSDPEYFNIKLQCSIKNSEKCVYCYIRVPAEALSTDTVCIPWYGIHNLITEWLPQPKDN